MNESTVRAMIEAHFEASNISVAGGGARRTRSRARQRSTTRTRWWNARRARAPPRQGQHLGFPGGLPGPPSSNHRIPAAGELWVNE